MIFWRTHNMGGGIPPSEEYGWTPRAVDGTYVAPAAFLSMTDGGFKSARSTGWTAARNVPLRVVAVDPHRPLGEDRASRLFGIARDAVEAVDRMCGPRPSRPASIDITLYLWDGTKRLGPGDDRISPANANTGVTVRTPHTGACDILVYRREEAVKTIAHEVLHAYGVGDWANYDPGMLAACGALARAVGLRVESEHALKPTEAIVDSLAIRLTAEAFGGRSWEDCVRHAERLAARLAARAAAAGAWRQSTGAFEYYFVKPLLMRRMDDLLAAHRAGLQRPDRAAVRRALRPAPPSRPSRRPGRSIVMRMTPRGLADLADLA